MGPYRSTVRLRENDNPLSSPSSKGMGQKVRKLERVCTFQKNNTVVCDFTGWNLQSFQICQVWNTQNNFITRKYKHKIIHHKYNTSKKLYLMKSQLLGHDVWWLVFAIKGKKIKEYLYCSPMIASTIHKIIQHKYLQL